MAGTAPQHTSNVDGVDPSLFPPCALIADAMHLAVMDTAERNHEFVAHLAADDAQITRVGEPASASAATASLAAPGAPENPAPTGIDKSALGVAEPRRHRDKQHLRFIAKQACLVCGRKHSDPHHLGFMQPRALGRKASDEFAVPLCRIHHREVHRVSDEAAWWKQVGIEPIAVARKLWECTRLTNPA